MFQGGIRPVYSCHEKRWGLVARAKDMESYCLSSTAWESTWLESDWAKDRMAGCPEAYCRAILQAEQCVFTGGAKGIIKRVLLLLLRDTGEHSSINIEVGKYLVPCQQKLLGYCCCKLYWALLTRCIKNKQKENTGNICISISTKIWKHYLKKANFYYFNFYYGKGTLIKVLKSVSFSILFIWMHGFLGSNIVTFFFSLLNPLFSHNRKKPSGRVMTTVFLNTMFFLLWLRWPYNVGTKKTVFIHLEESLFISEDRACWISICLILLSPEELKKPSIY